MISCYYLYQRYNALQEEYSKNISQLAVLKAQQQGISDALAELIPQLLTQCKHESEYATPEELQVINNLEAMLFTMRSELSASE